MFRGVYSISIDAKGRVAMPTRLRQRLDQECQGQLVITIDTEERCLLIYPLPQWEIIQEKIEALPSFNKAARRIQRLLIGHATDIECDSNGRFLVPLPLREYATLNKTVVLLGQGNKLELWGEEHWHERRDTWLDDESVNSEEQPPELQSLSL